ncbi:MAG: glycosyltransferase family 1 protein [Candidatus Electrothrix sp. GM3_4]|nr:glycosyltransferase family 1 protein [Candidatus Electrothrix sp. GM3_4]
MYAQMKKTTVLILCPWYDPYRVPLLRELAREFDITVLYTMRKEVGREWQAPEDLPFSAHFLEPIFLWKTNQMFGERLLIRYPAGLVKMLRKINPDVVVSLEFRFDCIIGALWAKLNQRGYVIWSDMTKHHDMRMGLLRRGNRRFLLSFAHALIGSCTDTLNHFSDNFGYSKSKEFLSSLSAHIQERIAPANLPKRQHEKSNDQICFVYVGELTPRKGVDLLIRSFARLLEPLPEAVLTLVGKGIEKEKLESLALNLGCENSVIFKGSVPYESVPGEMVTHDVFILPARLDVFGLVVAEAVACGLPVICSRYAGAASDLVKENGLIVDPENLDEMASAMEKMARNPQMRVRMAEAGRLIMQKNSLSAAVKGYADAIRLALLSTSRGKK